MKPEFITKYLALGTLDTEKPLVYGILNTELFDQMGYVFIAMDDSDGLLDVGCFPEDITSADELPVGGVHVSREWPTENAILIVKMKDDRRK